MFRIEFLLSGSGGQGLILAGIVLADAGLISGFNAVQSQSYGPQARGGASRSEVIVADDPIYYPKVTRPDVLLAMSQQACERYAGALKDGGVLVLDSGLVTRVPGHEIAGKIETYSLPITEIARSQVGRAMTANMVALGLIGYLAGVLPYESLNSAVEQRVPEKTLEFNLRALRLGWDLGSRNALRKREWIGFATS